MRLIQHKKEAYWFYRFLSAGYDRWVNPIFWTPEMRSEALRAARLDDRGLEVLDAGAGTGFTTEGIVEAVDHERVTMLDQSPHQLGRAERKPQLAGVRKLLGDAEALVIGPVPPGDRILRALAELWMLFPTEAQYRDWFARAGFEDVEVTAVAPAWYRDPRSKYAVAVSGRKPAPGPSPLALTGGAEDVGAPMGWRRRLVFAGRFALGSLAGFVFVPVGFVLSLRRRR